MIKENQYLTYLYNICDEITDSQLMTISDKTTDLYKQCLSKVNHVNSNLNSIVNHLINLYNEPYPELIDAICVNLLWASKPELIYFIIKLLISDRIITSLDDDLILQNKDKIRSCIMDATNNYTLTYSEAFNILLDKITYPIISAFHD